MPQALTPFPYPVPPWFSVETAREEPASVTVALPAMMPAANLSVSCSLLTASWVTAEKLSFEAFSRLPRRTSTRSRFDMSASAVMPLRVRSARSAVATPDPFVAVTLTFTSPSTWATVFEPSPLMCSTKERPSRLYRPFSLYSPLTVTSRLPFLMMKFAPSCAPTPFMKARPVTLVETSPVQLSSVPLPRKMPDVLLPALPPSGGRAPTTVTSSLPIPLSEARPEVVSTGFVPAMLRP